MQAEYIASSRGLAEHSFCQSRITRGIFRQFVYTIFAYSEQLIHHAISSQLSYNHQSSILQSSPVTTNHHTNLIIYSPHIILTSYHIILILHYSLPYSLSHYSLSASFLTYPFLYISYYPSCPTTQLSYLLFIFSPFISSPLLPYFLIPSHFPIPHSFPIISSLIIRIYPYPFPYHLYPFIF